MLNIEVGQIWQVVTDDLKGNLHCRAYKRDVILCLKRDEYIEIRYPFAWHYRTEDDVYMHSKPQDILKNCRLIGEIDKDVRFENATPLHIILDKKLYKAVWDE